MAIQIRELHIRAVVDNSRDEQARASKSRESSDESRESLIAQCVERVMELLDRRQER